MTESDVTGRSPPEERRIDGGSFGTERCFAAWIILGYGGLLVFAALLHDFPHRPVPTELFLFGFETLLIALPASAITYGGYWLTGCRFGPQHQRRILNWCGWGSLAAASLFAGAALYATWTGYEPGEAQFLILLSLATGGAAGVLFGVKNESLRLHASNVESQRDTLRFLNRLLRHHVLNGMNVIQGYSDELLAQLDDDDRQDLQPVKEESERIVEVIENVRNLISALSGEVPVYPVDLGAVLDAEVERLRDRSPEAVVEADLPEDIWVCGSDLLPLVFENLFRNAVMHNDRNEPTVAVSVVVDPELATVTIADDGPGIPENQRAAVGDPGTYGDAGIGLWLVSELVEEFEGDLRIRDNQPRGTAIEVDLRRVQSPESG